MLPQNAELDAIREVLHQYRDGLQTGNIDQLRSAFHPKAMMYAMTGEEEMAAEIEGLFSYVAANEAPQKTGEPHHCVITHLHYAGNIANAEMVQEACYGNDYMNYFQLIKTGGKWTIVSKTYTGKPTRKQS